MTPAELLQFTYCRFKLSVVSLMLLISAFLFYNIFHHSVTLIGLAYALVYIVVLNIGIRGATSRHVGMIRFYWVFQVVQLIVFFITILAIAGLLTYSHVMYLKFHQTAVDPVVVNQPTKTIALNGNTLTVHGNGEKTVVIQDVQQTTAMARPAYECNFLNFLHAAVPFLIPALINFIVIFSVTRSIVLARQLIALIEVNAAMGDVELSNTCCQEETEEPATQEPAYTPESVYVMPQAAYIVSEYPGQLMPVYVDKFGKPVH